MDFLKRACFNGIRCKLPDAKINRFNWIPNGNRKSFGNWFCAFFRLGYVYNPASDIETQMSVIGNIALQWCENYLWEYALVRVCSEKNIALPPPDSGGFNEWFTEHLLAKTRDEWVNCRRLIVKHGVVLDQDTSSFKPDSPLEGEHADMISSACPSVVQWDQDKKTFVQTNDELSRPLPCTKMEIKWPTKKRKIIR